jgi:probable rRNA maturation factor
MQHPPIVSIRNITRGTLPRVPFEEIARAILGQRYDLSLVVCGDALAQRLNKETRKKTYRPNVLSFPLDAHEGEIVLNIRCAEREARRFGISIRERVALLFVHGCLHLKGFDHETERDAGRMEAEEARVLRAHGFVA